MAACGVLGMSPSVIAEWSSSFRAQSGPTAPLQLNTWIPDPPALRDPQKERKMRDFLQRFGPEVPEAAGDATGLQLFRVSQAFRKLGKTLHHHFE